MLTTPEKTLLVGIGEMGLSSRPGEVLKTMALGSCVAVMCWHPERLIAGMVHVALPDSAVSPSKAIDLPGYFADTGLPALLNVFHELGCRDGNLTVKLAGGANVMDPGNTFNIGKRNVLAIKKILWARGMGPLAEDVGGNISRTVSMDVTSGAVRLSSPGLETWEL